MNTMGAPRPLVRAPLSSQIAERLRDDIRTGAHPPGAQLHEVELAFAFGVSRGPLREAMQRLVQEGLLRSEPHRGVFVIEVSEEDVLDVFFVRAALETAALRRIVDHGDRAGTAAALRAIAKRMDKAMKSGNWAAGGDLDFEYHRTLVDAAGSARLSRTYATVQVETRLCLHRLMGGYRSSTDLAVEHLRLASMIADAGIDDIQKELKIHFGDPDLALRRARDAADAGRAT